MGSPVGIRPDALCSTGTTAGGGSIGTKQSTIYATQTYDQKSTPSSRQSTLKRNDTSNTYSLLQQQQQPHHLQSKPPPATTTGLPQYSASYASGESGLLDYDKPYGYSTLQYNHNPPPLVDPYSYKSSTTDPTDPLDYDKNLDYRLLNISNEIKNSSTTNHIEYRNNSHNSSNNLQAGVSGNSACSNRPHTGSTGGSGGNPEYRYSGSEFATDLMDFSNVPSPSSSTNIGATLSKNRNRQHIITDTLPGPESCVQSSYTVGYHSCIVESQYITNGIHLQRMTALFEIVISTITVVNYQLNFERVYECCCVTLIRDYYRTIVFPPNEQKVMYFNWFYNLTSAR